MTKEKLLKSVKALEILIQFQKWRTGDIDYFDYTWKQLSEAIKESENKNK